MSSLIIMIVVIAIFGLVFMGGFFLNRKGNQLGADEKHLQQRLDQLPMLTSEKEIAEAIKGTPKDYLIKNYRFEKCRPVADDVFELLTGKYLCVDITEETYTLMRKKLSNMQTGKSPYYAVWVEKPYRQVVGGFCFNDGTPIEGSDTARFIFSFKRKMQRVFKNEINPDKADSFFMSRYYPDRSLNMANPEKAAQDFVKGLGKDVNAYFEQLGDKEKTFGKRYNFTYMSQGDKATFAARLGDGKADMNVFDDDNVVIVGGSKIPISSQGDIMRIVYKVFGYLLMCLSSLIGTGVLVALILSLFEKK